MGIHPSVQFKSAEGLDDVIHGPHSEPFVEVFGLGQRDQEDYRDGRRCRVLLEGDTDLETVHAGHSDIKEDQVRVV